MTSFLQNYQRQPKLFIDLPSKGKWYDETVIEGGQYLQIPVFGMNAMDEILFKTPDALFSGEATAQVIRSCIPTILDPWKLVSYDIDFILIALRIATYTEKMNVSTRCISCSSDTESVIDLNRMLDGFTNYPTEFSFDLQNFTFHLSPITYKQYTEFSMENYVIEREMFQVEKIEDNNQRHSEMQKLYAKSSELNLRLATTYISAVSRDDAIETNVDVIRDFVKNNDAEFYEKLRAEIKNLTERWNLPTFDIKCANTECDKTYKSRVNVDYSNFFGVRWLHSRNLI